MANDDVPFGSLRLSCASLKSQFLIVNNPHKPCRAWLVHAHGDGPRPDCSLIEGFEVVRGNWRFVGVPVSRPEQRAMRVDGTEIPGGRTPGFKRMVQVEGWDILKPLVDDAARLMIGMPVTIQEELWANLPERAEVKSDSLAWVAAVFELAWQAHVGSPLGAAKQGIPFHATAEQLIDFKTASAGSNWYSTLDNFAVASVYAIDILLSWLDTATVKPAATSSGVDTEPKGSAGDEQTARLKPCEAVAWSQYRRAAGQNSEPKTDRLAYDWFAEHMADDSSELPTFAAWSRYLRGARNKLNQNKNSPRIGNETRSVVSAKRIG